MPVPGKFKISELKGENQMKKIILVIIILMTTTFIFSANYRQLDEDFNKMCIAEHCGVNKTDPFNRYNTCKTKIENTAYRYKLAVFSDDNKKIKDVESELLKFCPAAFKK